MRYSDLTETDRVLTDAQRTIKDKLIDDTTVQVRIDKGRPPLAKNAGSDRLAETAQKLYGEIGKTIEPIAMRFGTDAGYAYVPDSDKPAVLETMGVVGAGLHAGNAPHTGSAGVRRRVLRAIPGSAARSGSSRPHPGSASPRSGRGRQWKPSCG